MSVVKDDRNNGKRIEKRFREIVKNTATQGKNNGRIDEKMFRKTVKDVRTQDRTEHKVAAKMLKANVKTAKIMSKGNANKDNKAGKIETIRVVVGKETIATAVDSLIFHN